MNHHTMTNTKPLVRLEDTDATVTDKDGNSRAVMAELWGGRDPLDSHDD